MHRFDGLDRLRGVALFAMLVHHLLSWTGGDERVRELLQVADGFVATDLAAPAFAVAVGASAVLSAPRVRSGGSAAGWRNARRWGEIFVWGVVLGVAIDGKINSFGVLETFALVGAAVTVVAVLGGDRRSTVGWAVVAVVLTAVSMATIEATATDGGVVQALFAGRFPLVSYLALGCWGAAIAGAQRGRERPWGLLGASAAGVVALVVLARTGVAVWPPDRSPGGPQLIVPGVVATALVWSAVAFLPSGRVVDGVARAGQRTLEVFVAHYVLRVLVDAFGWRGDFPEPLGTITSFGLAVLIFLAAARPSRSTPVRRDEPTTPRPELVAAGG